MVLLKGPGRFADTIPLKKSNDWYNCTVTRVNHSVVLTLRYISNGTDTDAHYIDIACPVQYSIKFHHTSSLLGMQNTTLCCETNVLKY